MPRNNNIHHVSPLQLYDHKCVQFQSNLNHAGELTLTQEGASLGKHAAHFLSVCEMKYLKQKNYKEKKKKITQQVCVYFKCCLNLYIYIFKQQIKAFFLTKFHILEIMYFVFSNPQHNTNMRMALVDPACCNLILLCFSFTWCLKLLLNDIQQVLTSREVRFRPSQEVMKHQISILKHTTVQGHMRSLQTIKKYIGLKEKKNIKILFILTLRSAEENKRVRGTTSSY